MGVRGATVWELFSCLARTANLDNDLFLRESESDTTLPKAK